ncbi:hypothetical protein WN943_000113 [Citrus x changshan-huyou]
MPAILPQIWNTGSPSQTGGRSCYNSGTGHLTNNRRCSLLFGKTSKCNKCEPTVPEASSKTVQDLKDDEQTMEKFLRDIPLFTSDEEFNDDAEKKLHYKSDWYRYNLKRKVAGVPGVTKALFLARQAALAQEKNKKPQ